MELDSTTPANIPSWGRFWCAHWRGMKQAISWTNGHNDVISWDRSSDVTSMVIVANLTRKIIWKRRVKNVGHLSRRPLNFLPVARYDDVIKWKHFLRYWSFVGGIRRSSVGSSHRWIPLTKAIDAELWYFLWYAFEQTVVHTIDTPVIRGTIALIMMSL